ncbi:unnamed protein product [Rotaria magnacalcarata]|uniref:Uncharacterized protein n=1 Tax=Rotaria magnacalcarata TaxID=392030 RepID=A0A8S2JX36_9BILA|nr:unnamed protein product [Rotaria magnacalcarata]CAF3979953.1 unnamed protein product [Rotaria magnacalcarata]CAF4074557.1 unnamed protein product [Rotaria magnacalcarata]
MTFSPIFDQNDDIIVMTPPIVDSRDEAIEKPLAQTTTTPGLPRKSKPKSKSLGKRKTKCLSCIAANLRIRIGLLLISGKYQRKNNPPSQAETHITGAFASTVKSNRKKSLLRAYLAGSVPASITANEDSSSSSL